MLCTTLSWLLLSLNSGSKDNKRKDNVQTDLNVCIMINTLKYSIVDNPIVLKAQSDSLALLGFVLCSVRKQRLQLSVEAA